MEARVQQAQARPVQVRLEWAMDEAVWGWAHQLVRVVPLEAARRPEL